MRKLFRLMSASGNGIIGGTRSARVSLVVVLAAVGVCLSAPSAGAAPLFLESFNGSGTGVSFSNPTGLAVDESSAGVRGNVLVADGGSSNVVDLFDGEGAPPKGGTPNQLIHAFSFGPERTQVAVDDAAGSPSLGDVYVADTLNKLVEKFKLNASNEYEFVCELTGYGGGCQPAGGLATEPFGEVTGVAVDAHGNLYVSDFNHGVVDEFNAEGTNVRQIRSASSEVPLRHPATLALDSRGDLFVAQYEPSEPVLRFAAGSGGEVEPNEIPTEIDRMTSFGIAVDRSTDTVYVAHNTTIAQYSYTGSPEGETEAGPIGQAAGIAVDDTNGRVYVSDAVGETIDVFAPPPPLPPTVVTGSEFSKNVTSSSAELGALVNPNYFETRYYFQYGTDTSYSGGSIPAPPGIDIGAAGGSSGNLAIQAVPNPLLPGTTYHYRVVAENAHGTTDGPDRTFTTFASGAGGLPDGRAFEMVSPLDKNGGGVEAIDQIGGGGVVQATPDGNAITYASVASFGEPQGAGPGSQYLSTRHSGEWATNNITTPLKSDTYFPPVGTPYKAFSTGLSSALFPNGETDHPVENPPLASNAPPGYENVYLRNLGSRGNQAILTSTPAEPATNFYLTLEGATPDLEHVVVGSSAALTKGSTPSTRNLYEWSGGELQAVNILPGVTTGATTPQSALGSGANESNTISNDGLRVFWTNLEGEPAVYVRENGTRTVRLDESQGGPPLNPGEHQKSLFQTASADGSTAFFISDAPLTPEANTGPPCGSNCSRSGNDLYAFDTRTGALTDLTRDHNVADPSGADVLGVLGASEDGSYVYFVATGVLTTGVNAEGRAPTSGADNLYVEHAGETRFIATLSPDDENGPPEAGITTNDWSRAVGLRTARVASDGLHALFMSDSSLTGYDNTDARTGHPDEEIYLYDATVGGLVCASCNPSGARPIGPARIEAGTGYGNVGLVNGINVAAPAALYQSRELSAGGSRVFFDSTDALVPQDTNGKQDVYEWERYGGGSCRQAGGCIYLLSGGRGSEGAVFVDASADGNDVFFTTRDELVPQDTDQLVDLYDARAPHEPGEQVAFIAPQPPPQCGGEDCRPPYGASEAPPAPASATLFGAGNLPSPAAAGIRELSRCPRGKKLIRRRCVRERAKRRHSIKPKHARKALRRGAR